MIKALDRKLFRDLGQLRGQVITIGLVVAAGIASYVTMQSTFDSLQEAKNAYYERQRFGDVFVHLKRAPESVATRLGDIPGVARVYPRVTEAALLPIEGMSEPATGTIVSLPSDGPPPLNDVVLRTGRMPRPEQQDEVLVLEAFAGAHELEPGDTIPAVINGTMRQLRVVGTAMSPEYVFAVGDGGFTSDDEKVAVLWMNREAVAAAFDMEGGFNDAVLDLQPGASIDDVLDRVDAILEPYGALGAQPRAKQTSNYFLEGELVQLEQFATVVPVIFLSVAAFLVNVVLSRLVNLQRPEIATLKALGYYDRQIAFHYLKLVSVIVLIGTVVGLIAGAWLGGLYTDLYADYFKFPSLRFRISPRVAVVGVVISLIAAVVGALVAVRRITKLPPAEAMRPAAPLSYEKTTFELLGLHHLVGPSGRMIMREISRRPMRTLLSAVGIALAIAIMVVGRFSWDAIEHMIDVQFQMAWRDDAMVTFIQPIPERAVGEIEHTPGVLRAEGSRMVPVRYSNGIQHRDSVLHAYEDDSEDPLRQVVDKWGDAFELPREGVVLTRKLAEILDVQVGDEVMVEIREGERETKPLEVAGLVDESFGMQGYMRTGSLHRFLGEQRSINAVFLHVDPLEWDEVHARLQDIPGVAGVLRKDSMLRKFREQSGQMMMTMTMIMTLFAVVIAVGVVYNNARVALSMRSRDLASLRVLGFTRAEISAILLGELSVQVLLAIPIGLVLGTWMSEAVMSSVDPEQYRLPILISPRTYAFATVVALASGLVSALMVRRKLDKLDLIGVLKTRE